MKFRPCIDIHNGKVKQIVGSSLTDKNNFAKENFVSDKDAKWFSRLYREDGLRGGHIILLNKQGTKYYEEDIKQAGEALMAFPKGLQIGGGVSDINASFFIEKGASHVIVTSFVFQDGKINYTNLEKLEKAVGKKHIVLDLSCRKKDSNYYIVTNRWQTFTKEPITIELMEKLSLYCDEFLIHAVDVEGKASGVEIQLAELLGEWNRSPITYAGGVGTMEDVEKLRIAGKGKLDITVGSALDLFGGNIPYTELKNIR